MQNMTAIFHRTSTQIQHNMIFHGLESPDAMGQELISNIDHECVSLSEVSSNSVRVDNLYYEVKIYTIYTIR